MTVVADESPQGGRSVGRRATLEVVLDCSNPQKLMEFWREALGYRVLYSEASLAVLVAQDVKTSPLLLQRVREPKAGKNRMHVDIVTEDATKRQEQACRTFAQLREWEVDAVYEDVDLSAFRKGVVRPRYESLLRAIGDRGSRASWSGRSTDWYVVPAKSETFWRVCEANGDILASATEPIDTSTDLGVALVRILVSFAGLESATLSLRIRARLGDKARAGHPPPHMGFGFKKNPVRVVPKHARLIQDAADKVLAGESLRSIANDWNRKGVRTIRGSLWNYHTLKKLLCSHRIAGDREYKGEVVAKDCWPAILDHDTFERVRTVILAPKKMDKANVRRHLLTGLIFCGRCGSPFRAVASLPTVARVPHKGAAGFRSTVPRSTSTSSTRCVNICAESRRSGTSSSRCRKGLPKARKLRSKRTRPA
jgi:DNA invertase Pin-like site-specific DNA recombinase